MIKGERYLFILLLLVIFVLRLSNINNPPIEIEESWRQGDTESIARNFVEYDFSILHPNLNYDGPLPNIPALEIQITTFFIAILYKLFGFQYFYARIIPIIFFILSAYYIYLLSRQFLDWQGAFFSTAFYGFFPINLYYSRAIMPESAALFFFIAGFYYFVSWFKNQNNKTLGLSSILISFAIMTKPPTIFIALPMLFLCCQYKKVSFLKDYRLWLFGFSIILISGLYYFYSISIAEFKFSLGLSKMILSKNFIYTFTNSDIRSFFIKQLPRAFNTHCLLFAVVGILALKKNQAVLFVFFAAMILETLLIVGFIKAFYYLIFLSVPLSMIIGNGISVLLKIPIIKIVTLAFVLSIFNTNVQSIKPMYQINEIMKLQVLAVEKSTKKDDLLIAGSLDPCILSISGRRGWRFNVIESPSSPKNLTEQLNFFKENGAKYFIPIQDTIYGDKDGKILQYIKSTYEKIEIIKGYPIYKIN